MKYAKLFEFIVPLLCGMIVLSIGTLVMTGWSFEIHSLKSISSEWVSMKPNAALCFILSGAGLIISKLSDMQSRFDTILLNASRLIGWFVFIIGLITFIEYQAHVNLHIDQVLFKESQNPLKDRMANISAISFMIAGIALGLDMKEHGFIGWLKQVALCIGFFVAYFSFAGYIFGIDQFSAMLYAVKNTTFMAAHTSIAFIFLMTGLFFLHPHQGIPGIITSSYSGGVMARRLIPLFIIAPLILSFLNRFEAISAIINTQQGSLSILMLGIGLFVFAMFINFYCLNRYDEQKSIFEKELEEANQRYAIVALEANAANVAKSAFLAAMSHEIRTPLNGVIGMTSLLQQTPLNAEQTEYANIIRLSGESLLSVINDILDFSKIESGKMELDPTHFNIIALIEDVSEMMAAQSHAKGLTIASLIDEGIEHEWLYADKGRIRQVLNNLISNAIKFTDKGQIAIYVEHIPHPDSKLTFKFKITDTGVGIPAKTLKYLFQPFSQADISTSRKYGGTGLGLAISKRLVELMGGEIGVESTPGKGSTFWFTIQADKGQGEPHHQIPDHVIEAHKNTRLLCVDDCAINCEIIEKQAQSWHMTCDSAKNAQETLDLLERSHHENRPYDLALIDYVMPNMSGLELVAKLRANPAYKNIPVLMMTSLGIPLKKNELLSLGIHYCITKPVKQSRLFDSIMQTLHGTHLNNTPNVDSHSYSSTDKKSATILLAEDNIVNQQVAQRILKKLGYTADVVANGTEAVDAFKKNHYDLILMDCQMPDMDGYTAAQTIRALEKDTKSHCIIVALTAHALTDDKAKCLDAGMDDYMPKPIDINALSKLLDRWLDNASDQPLDLSRLHEIFGDDQEALDSFLITFIEDTQTTLGNFAIALDEQDIEGARKILHQIKGTTGNAGATELSSIAAQLDKALEHNELSAARALFDALQNAFTSLKSSVQAK